MEQKLYNLNEVDEMIVLVVRTDGDEEFATLDDFVREFWDRAVDLILNFIASE